MAVDPSTVLGSWDEVLFIPTNSTVGALTTGVGEAHSHPHASNLLTDGWLQSYYGNQWGVAYNGTTTMVDCGSGVTLDNLADNAYTAECWAKLTTTGQRTLMQKGVAANTGWELRWDGTAITARVKCATADASTYTLWTNDDKWHHWAVTWDDAGDRKLYVYKDGVLFAISGAGVGAIVSDAANNLTIGSRDASFYFAGTMGWIRLSNNVRYAVAGFKPSRTCPAADGNTIEQWLVSEGTGVTLTAIVTSPANNGTITNGTWQPQWYSEGTPIIPTSVQGSATYRADVGSGATIDDLMDNAFTVDGWFRIPKTGGNQWLCYKGNSTTTGWRFLSNSAGALQATVFCVTTNAVASSAPLTDNRWHHIAFTFDDAGDRKVRIWIDGVLAGTSVAGVGAVVSDAASSGIIGNSAAGITGGHGWIRWSNSVRYAAGFTPTSRYAGPAVDANTMAQWEATEGAGATLTDSSGNANHGTAAGTYSWINTGAMDYDSPGARIYGWGYAVGSDAVSEGVKQTFTGLTPGANYKIYALAYSEDGVGQPVITVYDEIGAAVIATITGTITSTEWACDRLAIAFELPALCTSISIKLLSATAGNVSWHKAELFASLVNDGGYELDDAVTSVGTPTTQDRSNVQAHSGAYSRRIITDAIGEGITHPITTTSGKFYRATAWVYSAANGVKMGDGVTLHSGATTGLTSVAAASWVRLSFVFRAAAAVTDISFISTAAVQTFYVDDFSVAPLDDVTLTVTPASAANSAEGTGIRVDGLDRLTQPILMLQMTKGKIQFPYTPRHSAATVALLGNATPVIAHFYVDANNYILLDWSLANTMRLRYNAGGAGVQTGTWDATGAIVAGTKYTIDIRYTAAGMTVLVNNVTRITIAAAVTFSVIPTTAYWGSDNSTTQQIDAVFG